MEVRKRVLARSNPSQHDQYGHRLNMKVRESEAAL